MADHHAGVRDSETSLHFHDPGALTHEPDGCPPHKRVTEDRKRSERVHVRDVCSGEKLHLRKHGCEFLRGGLGDAVGQQLREICSWEVFLNDQSMTPRASEQALQSCAHQPPGRELTSSSSGSSSGDASTERGLARVDGELSRIGTGVSDVQVKRLSRLLTWRPVRTHSGWLLIVHCAPIGVIRRVVYPMGGHPPTCGGGATVHADQDLGGDPLRSMDRCGILRWMLRHNWLRILNLWMPVGNMAAGPLCVMDLQTLRPEDKVRHNWMSHDGWYFLHGEWQKWYWNSDLGQGSGDVVVFDTLRSPHSAFELPGEQVCHEVREELVECLRDVQSNCLDSRHGGSIAERIQLLLGRLPLDASLDPSWPPPVRRALLGVRSELEAASSKLDTDVFCRSLRHLQRQSVEARCVALGPFPPLCLCLCGVGFGAAALLLLGFAVIKIAGINIISAAACAM
eukprot:CAMPEP_0177196174 /NCGR_PEP_ID=MMETSP0367-20130122/23905_1 /TAXON_ID=447022 ORGANISM="Scrippsiella hangoei-like, Strain SHHI-4" /NCGR_SAMPLE_ID=MMETSP0367 /ASSEMBLY_ACC=CAM_ASM_000362 /LENGTH=453 /DNA_ID=CAMNT_0018644249 /DNA_START=50 /DNA_END=1411 /DNA_ORIENTATION=+